MYLHAAAPFSKHNLKELIFAAGASRSGAVRPLHI
jgi:hypothetical protein